MKKIFILLTIILISKFGNAQQYVGNTELSRELYSKAINYQMTKDYSNAILVFNQLVQLEPENVIYRRNLAFSYFLKKEIDRAASLIAPVIKMENADEETFLIGSKIYATNKDYKAALNTVNKGLKKYPSAGILYSEKGILLANNKQYLDATEAWEKGVKNNPQYFGNYYHLTKSYFVSKRYALAIFYGENYLNFEKYSYRTEEIKRLVFDAYKQMISYQQLKQLAGDEKFKNTFVSKNEFEKTMISLYTKLNDVVLGGINIDNISIMRAYFLVEWQNKYDDIYPHALFRIQKNLIDNGYFETYNQWLFGKVNNEKAFIQWVQKNAKAFENFETYYKNSFYKPNSDELYQ